MTTCAAAHRTDDGEVAEVASDLQRLEDDAAELCEKVASAGSERQLYFRDDRPAQR